MFILAFARIDWLILAGYFCLMAVIGALAARKKTDAEGYFLAERSMPMFAVALSVVATSLSVATFLGAAIFIPRFYAAGTVTIYGYIDQRFGETSRLAVSCMFLLGRLLASGVRLFFAALPVCLLLFSEHRDGTLYVASKGQLIFAI